VLKGFVDGRLLVEGCEDLLARMGLGSRGIGGGYILDVSEAAYLIFTESATILDDSGYRVSLADLFRRYSTHRNDWIRFTVLLDLRLRGRRVRAGYSSDTLLLEVREGESLVFVAEENSPFTAGEIHEWVKSASLKGLIPIIALVDANGDVTYYLMRAQRVEDLWRWLD
jgi:tRNA splicing endonuclease